VTKRRITGRKRSSSSPSRSCSPRKERKSKNGKGEKSKSGKKPRKVSNWEAIAGNNFYLKPLEYFKIYTGFYIFPKYIFFI